MKWYQVLANALLWTTILFIGIALFVGSIALALANGAVGIIVWVFLFVVLGLTLILMNDDDGGY